LCCCCCIAANIRGLALPVPDIKGLALARGTPVSPLPPPVLGDELEESGDPPLRLPPLQLVGGELELELNVKSGV